jgi:hypothetical protein
MGRRLTEEEALPYRRIAAVAAVSAPAFLQKKEGN